jgi:hypothetical protein
MLPVWAAFLCGYPLLPYHIHNCDGWDNKWLELSYRNERDYTTMHVEGCVNATEAASTTVKYMKTMTENYTK